MTSEPLTLETLKNLFYKTFILNWDNVNAKLPHTEYFMLVAPNRLEVINILLAKNNNCKNIVDEREPFAKAYATIVHARNRLNNYEGMSQFDPTALYSDNLFLKYDKGLFHP
jgi:hypothetical protein